MSDESSVTYFEERLRRYIDERQWPKIPDYLGYCLTKIDQPEYEGVGESFLWVAAACSELHGGRQEQLDECYRRLGFESIPAPEEVPEPVLEVMIRHAQTYLRAYKPPLDTRLGILHSRIIEIRTA